MQINLIHSLVAKKATQEQDFRHRLSEASNNYELLLRNMRTDECFYHYFFKKMGSKDEVQR
jgi:hypothetical protein